MNFLDVVSMIPFFLVAYYSKYTALILAITFIGICGILHHYHIDNNQFLWLDLTAIGIGFSVYTYYSKIDKSMKYYLYILELVASLYFIVNLFLDTKVSDRILLLLIGIVWLPNLLFSIKHLSNLTIWGVVIVLLLYMYSRCLCTQHEYIQYTWPAFHTSVSCTLYLVLHNMEMLLLL